MSHTSALEETVIKNDYCIGCGVCSHVNPNYSVKMNQHGMYKAEYSGNSTSPQEDLVLAVCPFSNETKNENEIADDLYKEVENKNEFIGKYISNYVGYVKEGNFREKGSSGGFGKWILYELLQKGKVDYVIQVVSNQEGDTLFTFRVFTKEDDILSGSKSAYYPITLTDALDFIKNNEGKYAITAVPCFSKAIRNLCLQDETINDRVKYVVGIICGHLKSTAFAELFGWQLSVEPDDLGGIEFRDKIEGLRANEKGVYAITKSGQLSDIKSSKKMFGGDWGHGLFKYKACDYCDDIVGETTDVSVGDAWLKGYMDDHNGNNVLVVRNQEIDDLIKQGIAQGRLAMKEVEESIVVESQWGGIKHRREGLSYRLFLKNKDRSWHPKKRVTPNGDIGSRRKRIYKNREVVRDISHTLFLEAKKMGSLNHFIDSMVPYIKRLNYVPLHLKVVNKLFRIKDKLLG